MLEYSEDYQLFVRQHPERGKVAGAKEKGEKCCVRHPFAFAKQFPLQSENLLILLLLSSLESLQNASQISQCLPNPSSSLSNRYQALPLQPTLLHVLQSIYKR
jgi:hypothetical protein